MIEIYYLLQAMDGDKCVGAIVCKLDMHKKMVRRGYIAMLAIDNDVRRRGIGQSCRYYRHLNFSVFVLNTKVKYQG